MEQLFIYMLGAAGYGLLELLWRGHTHWTMLIVGGLCFFIIYYLFEKFSDSSSFLKATAGSFIITAIELIAGIIININLGWQVWDYSSVPLNLMGQICLPYSLLWFGVSFGLTLLCKKIKHFSLFLQNKTK